ncbi:site-2 protease family protein [Halovivax cerinus]|uniref:Site-2 protease family protein n=1 Tax=Halovivax cerinus TaxID=1487865 RepID=A0ABD5NPU4_9EURY|nr:site-2 protease family protein [Halovivax cerinus]
MDDALSAGLVPELFGSTLVTWVVIGVGLYWAGLLAMKRRDLLPEWVSTQGPILTLHTKRGRDLLDRLATPKRFWRAWSNFGVGIALVVMVAMFVFLLLSAISSLLAPEPTGIQQPRNVLVIPGVNDFLPLSATPGIVVGLFVGLVVHEGGHGLLCRVEDIDIDSMGVALLAVLPIGAFVQPDEESSKAASRGGQTRMFAAGVTNNLAVTILAFLALFWLVGTAVAVAPGAAIGGVVDNSAAADADLDQYDRITHVDGQPIENNREFADVLDATGAGTITLTIDGERDVPVHRTPIVFSTLPDGPTGLELHDQILSVDGTAVSTREDLVDAVGDAERVAVETESADGTRETREIPVGASMQVLEGSSLADAGAPVDSFLVVTTADGQRIHDGSDLETLIREHDGETLALSGYADGERVTYEVAVDADAEQYGPAVHDGISGMQVNDVGVQLYPAETFHSALGGDSPGGFGPLGETFFGKVFITLMLPIMAIAGLQSNFAGFAGGVENVYELQGSLSALGEPVVFGVANLLFWTGWINLNLAFFNCIPAFPLDGGHILRTSTETVLARLPGVDATRGMVRVVTTMVGVTMLASFLVMIFAPTLLA